MDAQKFINLVNALTKREFTIQRNPSELVESAEYYIYRTLPATGRNVGFVFKTPKNPENIVKTFINQYCKKYREPNPANYDGKYPGSVKWEDKSEEQREYAYSHHASNMYSEKTLLEQIKENLNSPEIELALCRYGFYETHYGLGIFVLFSGRYEQEAIARLSKYLNGLGIPYSNEFSQARWVYRFVLNVSKEIHKELLQSFHKSL